MEWERNMEGKMEEDECTRWIKVWKNGGEGNILTLRKGRKEMIIEQI
jgi:hypothetical protein